MKLELKFGKLLVGHSSVLVRDHKVPLCAIVFAVAGAQILKMAYSTVAL